MHDIRAIRENPAAFQAALDRRGLSDISATILKLDEARRSKILASETAQALQNAALKEAGIAKGRGDQAEFNRLRSLVAEKKAETTALAVEADRSVAAGRAGSAVVAVLVSLVGGVALAAAGTGAGRTLLSPTPREGR